MAEVEDAHRKIKELEAQMELLKEKATAAGTHMLGINTSITHTNTT
jgi:hypothetical protein